MIIAHDLYQTSVYFGLPAWTLNFTAGSDVEAPVVGIDFSLGTLGVEFSLQQLHEFSEGN